MYNWVPYALSPEVGTSNKMFFKELLRELFISFR